MKGKCVWVTMDGSPCGEKTKRYKEDFGDGSSTWRYRPFCEIHQVRKDEMEDE